MRRTFFCIAFLLSVLAVGNAAAQKAMPFKLRNVIDRAVTNERQAVTRYELFAQKATDEGYIGAASLFHAAARAEAVHARRFEKAMRERGMDIPAPPTDYRPNVGSTSENLRLSSSNESEERDGIYREAIAAAKEAGDPTLMQVFDQTRDTEVEHANLMSAAARQLDNFRKDKAFYVCNDCGYTTDIALPMCALCRTRTHPDEVH
jgi:rubrerythrin